MKSWAAFDITQFITETLSEEAVNNLKTVPPLSKVSGALFCNAGWRKAAFPEDVRYALEEAIAVHRNVSTHKIRKQLLSDIRALLQHTVEEWENHLHREKVRARKKALRAKDAADSREFWEFAATTAASSVTLKSPPIDYVEMKEGLPLPDFTNAAESQQLAEVLKGYFGGITEASVPETILKDLLVHTFGRRGTATYGHEVRGGSKAIADFLGNNGTLIEVQICKDPVLPAKQLAVYAALHKGALGEEEQERVHHGWVVRGHQSIVRDFALHRNLQVEVAKIEIKFKHAQRPLTTCTGSRAFTIFINAEVPEDSLAAWLSLWNSVSDARIIVESSFEDPEPEDEN